MRQGRRGDKTYSATATAVIDCAIRQWAPALDHAQGRVRVQRPFVVIRTRGPAWDDSWRMDDQTDCPAHAAFMDSLAAERFVLLGGPFEGTRDVLLVVQAQDCSEIEARLGADPWTQNGLLTTNGCWPWRIRLGSPR